MLAKPQSRNFGALGGWRLSSLVNFGLTLPSSYVMVHLLINNIPMDNKCLPSKVFPALIVSISIVLIVMNRGMSTLNEKT
jgi:hypothetical protein